MTEERNPCADDHETWEPPTVERLKRRMAWEGKKVESLLKAFGFALSDQLDEQHTVVLERLQQVEESIEALAREVQRRAAGMEKSSSGEGQDGPSAA
jgi:hypothetical protein